jgi:hypothetical protein
MRLFAGSLSACVLLVPALASAHIRMTSPTPRNDNDGLKAGPGCGVIGEARGTNVTVLRSGSLLRLEWDETVPHPSHYRISFDPDGEDDFADPPEMMDFNSNPSVLMDGIENTGDHMTVDVPLPDVECERCTLQLIQVMYDKQPYEPGGNDIYYQCADLVLRKDAPGPCAQEADGGAPDGGSACNPASGADGGAVGGDGDGDGVTNGGGGYTGGSGTPAAADETSGYTCAAGTAHHGSRVIPFALLASALLIRVRRRR